MWPSNITTGHGNDFCVIEPLRGNSAGGFPKNCKALTLSLLSVWKSGWTNSQFASKQMNWATTLTWRHCNDKQRVLMRGHQGWNVRHGLCHIYMIYVYIWVVYSFCLFCGLFIIVTTQFVALYKPCKPKPKPSTYDPLDNHPLAEIQRPILRPKPKQ